jgi:uncharacterized protein YPO0396
LRRSVDETGRAASAGFQQIKEGMPTMNDELTVGKIGKDGGGKPPAPLTPTRVAHVEQGLRAFQETEAEMEGLRKDLDRTRQELKARDLEIASLNQRIETMRDDHASERNRLESRSTTCEAARDEAVSEMTALKTILASMKKIFDLVPKE